MPGGSRGAPRSSKPSTFTFIPAAVRSPSRESIVTIRGLCTSPRVKAVHDSQPARESGGTAGCPGCGLYCLGAVPVEINVLLQQGEPAVQGGLKEPSRWPTLPPISCSCLHWPQRPGRDLPAAEPGARRSSRGDRGDWRRRPLTLLADVVQPTELIGHQAGPGPRRSILPRIWKRTARASARVTSPLICRMRPDEFGDKPHIRHEGHSTTSLRAVTATIHQRAAPQSRSFTPRESA